MPGTPARGSAAACTPYLHGQLSGGKEASPKRLGSQAALLLGQMTSFGSFAFGAEFAPSHQKPGVLEHSNY